MGLMDCVASPEGRDAFDEYERPVKRPQHLSRSDHDISKRRGLPLFASQASLRNSKDIEFWRRKVLYFLYSPEGKHDIRVLRVPFSQLGFATVTDFISDIPSELFQQYQTQPPPDDGLLKEFKVFWVRDGIAEPGTFKWNGIIENASCFGLQLDRKKAVPYGIYDGRGLFSCKVGHRAIVPEHEVIPYKKFLRTFLGLPPRKDSLLEYGDSVRLSAGAIRAKNAKKGDRVYLPKEKRWATVQWIGKIDNETVVDLIYERPKTPAGQAVSPDEPCVSRSMSLADFIGELASEPNTPVAVQAPQGTVEPRKNSVPSSPYTPTPPLNSTDQSKSPSPLTRTQSGGTGPVASEDDEDDDDFDSSDIDSEEESDSEEDESDFHSETEPVSVIEKDPEQSTILPRTKEMEDVSKLEEQKVTEVFHDFYEDSSNIRSPKKKGFFGFSPKDKSRSKSLPSVQKEEALKEKVKSDIELEQKSPKARSKSPNIFSNFKFKKNQKQKPLKSTENEEGGHFLKEKTPEMEDIKSKPFSPKKPKGKSQWSGLFKSRSKGSLSKLIILEPLPDSEAPQTPVDKMIPPDKIPTPPPPVTPEPKYNERQIDRPEHLDIIKTPEVSDVQVTITKPTPPGPPKESYEMAIQQQLDNQRREPESQSQSSDSDFSDNDEDTQDVEVETTKAQLHSPPATRTSTDSSTDGAAKAEEVKSPGSDSQQYTDFPPYLAICPPYIPPQSKQEECETETPTPETPPPIPATAPPRQSYHEDELPASPPPIPTTPPPDSDDSAPESQLASKTEPTEKSAPALLLESFKESKVRNRPSSFGSFLARIKNQRRIPGEVIKYPDDEKGPASEDISRPENAEQIETTPQPEPISQVASDLTEGGYDNPAGPQNTDSPVFEIQRSLVKPPKPTVQPKAVMNTNMEVEGDQDGITLDLLDVKETASSTSPPESPPATAEETPKPKSRPFSFSFSLKRKSSQTQTPTTPKAPIEDFSNENVNLENPEPSDSDEKEKEKKKTSSFRSSFRRTFSLTRKNKQQSQSPPPENNEQVTTPTTPTKSNVSKPRPVSLYIDNNEVVQQRQKKNSFKSKRPASVVVDIKPWNMRRGTEGVDIYSGSSEDSPNSPDLRSPNPALVPKAEYVDIPKHRIFTTPGFFYRKGKKDSEDSVGSKGSKTKYERFNRLESTEKEPKSMSVSTPALATTPVKTPPPLPTSPPPPLVKQRSKSTSFETPPTPEAQRGILKSALKQRKEIESIPRGLKVGDRVLWYSSQGPIPGTVQRLFKDGTDKYTAMVEFDREIKDAPLRLIREGDAYIITVEELITPDMFQPKPIYANQEEIGLDVATTPRPQSPSVRFNEEECSNSEDDAEELRDLPPPFQEDEVQQACGFRRGIQCRDTSCCLESILFALFYTTNAFDLSILYGNNTGEDRLTRNVRKILRREIVDPLRREGFVSVNAVKRLREAVKPLSEEWQTMSTDAEVMMFILFDRALKLNKFLRYSNDMSDFLHQLVVDPKDLSKSTTVQQLFEASLHLMDKLKLRTVPTPALILEMPRSNDKLMQYTAVIPNLTIHVSHLLHDGPRLCICGVVAQYECIHCTKNVGRMSIVYCDHCKGTADVIHFQLPHEAQLSPLSQPMVILDLVAIICLSKGHYMSFVKCGNEKHSPWVYFDGAEIENPKVCIEQNLGMWLDRLEKYPGKYQDALEYPLLTHILQDSHICIYQPREKSSSV